MGGQMVPMGGPGGEIRLGYIGEGSELFGKMFVGYLLTMITFGIYLPWFICSMLEYLSSKTSAGPTQKGQLQFKFQGEGSSLFGLMFVGYLLTALTIGIYAPWFMCKLARYMAENSVAVAQDGTQYKLRFTGEGGDLFGTAFVGYLLTMITFGIYLPWFICKMRKWFMSHTQIDENGQPVGAFDFVGEGGELFGKWIVGVILTVLTIGIYKSWFDCVLSKFNAQNTRMTYRGAVYTADFNGQGGELFVLRLVGGLLTAITFGIYMFWYMTNLIKFNVSNHVIRRAS